MLSQEKYSSANPVVSFVIRRFFERIAALAAAVGPGTVLDAGCGEGEILRRRVLGDKVRVTSLDLRIESLGLVRGHSTPAAMVAGSVLSLPFRDASFDLVTCMEVLEHLEDPPRAVDEAARVARQAVIFSVPWEPWFRAGNFVRGKYVSAFGNHPEHIQHWNFSSFEKLLARRYSRMHLVEAFPWMIALCRTSDRLPR